MSLFPDPPVADKEAKIVGASISVDMDSIAMTNEGIGAADNAL